jgi:hypothetical protein
MKSTNKTRSTRRDREWEMIEKMVQTFCEHRHHRYELCADCQQLLKTVHCRLETCRYGADKPVCTHCSYRCYGRDCREKMKVVMSAALPHMLWQHPRLSMRYWLDSFHRTPLRAMRTDFAAWGGE